MCLYKTCSKFSIGENSSEAMAIQNGVNQGHNLMPLFFNLSLVYAITKVHEIQKGLELNGTRLLLFYYVNINTMGENMNIQNYTECLLMLVYK
jgi:hypothetical protein